MAGFDPVVLRPGWRSPGRRREARRARLVARPGVVELLAADGSRRTLTASAAAGPTAAVVTEPAAVGDPLLGISLGRLLFIDDAGQVLAGVELADWVPELPAAAPAARPPEADDVLSWGQVGAFCATAGLPLSRDESRGDQVAAASRPEAPLFRTGSNRTALLGGAALPLALLAFLGWLVALGVELAGPDSAATAARGVAAAALWIYLAGIVLMWAAVLVPRLRELPSPAAQAEWRPRPGVPTSRRFRSVSRVRRSGGELVVVEPDGTELWLGGPDEPTGVHALVLARARKADLAPVRAELVDAQGTALAWLSWPEWGGGARGEEAAREFAARAGLELRERVGSVAGAAHLAVPRPAHATGVLAEARWGVSSAVLIPLAAPGAIGLVVEYSRTDPSLAVLLPAAAGVLLTLVPVLARVVTRLIIDRPGAGMTGTGATSTGTTGEVS